ncbi:MAG TPA: hypothetical protein VNN17_00240 [Terriglobia bacterium]|nr:hypothetical protein [Terriglobia bacterium]
MTAPRTYLGMLLLLLLGTLPASAQLERVVVMAEPGDIDCLPCAVTIELNVRKVEGVNKVAVSMSKQMVAITFKEGARLRLKDYRDAIFKAEVRVAEMHAAMRGQIEQQGNEFYFVLGPDRFPIANPPKDLPVGKPVGIMATMDDSTEPPTIRSIEDVKLL